RRHLDRCIAVFEVVRHPHDGRRKLAFLADRHESLRMSVGERARDDEPARFDARNGIDVAPFALAEQAAQRRNRRDEVVSQQWRDVPKQDAWLREIGDLADVLSEFAHVRRYWRVGKRTLA